MADKGTLDQRTRQQIAGVVVLWGPLTVLLLGALIVGFSQDRSQASQTVLNSVLPLLGTWVGTVLAFYFAKDNFEAASQSAKELLNMDERLRSIPAREAMILIEDADTFTIPEGVEPGQVRLQDLVKVMKDKDRNRLPVLDQKNAPVFIIHLSTLTEFLAEQPEAAAQGWPGRADLTVDQLKQRAEKLYVKILAWGCIRSTASLAEAKAVMESKPDCSDVFVTPNGRRDQAVLGWITNIEIGLRSRA